MGLETALLFCAIRAAETLGTLSFTRDTRAGYEIALCMHKTGYSSDAGDLDICLNAPGRVLDILNHPRRFGSVASCDTGAFVKDTPHKVRKKYQARFQPADE